MARLLLILLLLLLSADVSGVASKKKAAKSKRRAVDAARKVELPLVTSTQQADAMINDELQTGQTPPHQQQGDLHALLGNYAAIIEHTRTFASLAPRLQLLDASAKLARKLKQHESALSYHREMLTLKGQAGALPWQSSGYLQCPL